MLLAARGGSYAAFYPLVFFHVVAALMGFGSIGFAGSYASRAAQMASAGEAGSPKDPPAAAVAPLPVGAAAIEPSPLHRHGELLPPGGEPTPDAEVEELVRYFERPARFWKAMLVVPVFGVLALWAQPGGDGLDQVWDITALLVWGAAALVATGIIVPSLRRVQGVLNSVPPVAGAGDLDAPIGVMSRGERGRAAPVAGAGNLAAASEPTVSSSRDAASTREAAGTRHAAGASARAAGAAGPSDLAGASDAAKEGEGGSDAGPATRPDTGARGVANTSEAGALHAGEVQAPNEGQVRAWATPANRSRLARYGRLASRGAAVCDVLFFVALALMIWQP
jgi:hypothetical protein